MTMPGVNLKLKAPTLSALELRLFLFKKDQHCFVSGDMLDDLRVTPIMNPETGIDEDEGPSGQIKVVSESVAAHALLTSF